MNAVVGGPDPIDEPVFMDGRDKPGHDDEMVI